MYVIFNIWEVCLIIKDNSGRESGFWNTLLWMVLLLVFEKYSSNSDGRLGKPLILIGGKKHKLFKKLLQLIALNK